VRCSAASLDLILVVITESRMNALGCARSASASWATAIGPASTPASSRLVAMLVILIGDTSFDNSYH
jgi:hypothetical protein